MKTTHITDLLDGKAFTELSSEDLAAFDAHINVCLKCRHAFQASQISSVLLRANADTIAPLPSPFFQAKVMNAWREKQSLQKPI